MKTITAFKSNDGKVFETEEECIKHDAIIPFTQCKQKLVDWFNDWYFNILKLEKPASNVWVNLPYSEGTIWYTVEKLFETGILEEVFNEYQAIKKYQKPL